MTDEKEQPIYRVIFSQNDVIREIHARSLCEESLMGFIEVEELVLNDVKSAILVDPEEEKLRAEFKGVKRSYIPMHTILRIDELMQEDTTTRKSKLSVISGSGSKTL